MFVNASFPEAAETKPSSQNTINAVVLHGNESQVRNSLEMFDCGAAQVIMSPILAGHDKEASLDRTMQLLADVSRTMGTTSQSQRMTALGEK